MTTIAEVDQAEQALAAAKASGDAQAVKDAKEEVRKVRQAYREEEVAAGRRSPTVGVIAEGGEG